MTSLGALAGCTPAEDGGVHVIVTVDPAAWPAGNAYLFDAITVTATSADGTARGAACLFYTDEAQREVQADAYGPTACADSHTAAWVAPPSLADWRLVEQPRTVNFVFPSGTDLTVSAVAGLGGRLDVGKAFGSSTADAEYSPLTLTLGPGVPSLGAECKAQLERVPEGFSKLVVAQPELCLSDGFRDARGACATDVEPSRRVDELPQGHAASMTCVGTASRIAEDPSPPCAGDDPGLAWRAPIDPRISTACVNVLVTGHFARCDAADCSTLTTACTPPLTEIGVVQKGRQAEAVSFSCLPPFAQPVTFLVKVPRPSPLSVDQDFALFLHTPTGVQDPCFFDLYSLAFQAATCD
jgi:hypothetical protein